MTSACIKIVVMEDIQQDHIYLDFHWVQIQDINYGFVTVVSLFIIC